MKKQILIAILGSLIILSCGQGNKEKQTNVNNENVVFEQVALDSLLANTENYIDKSVSFEGTVSHVCKHGGQKMFLFSSSDSNSIKVTTGKNYSEFKVELEGSTVRIDGIVKEQRIDETYLAEWEAEVKKGTTTSDEENEEMGEKEEHEGKHMGDGMESHEKSNEDLEKIEQLRKKIEASEKGYLSNFSVECVKYEELANPEVKDSVEVKEAE
ncbi:MAG: hypothetical protein GXO79_03330 [Chlorobi bacterium]|nr:hypothetical protein [Chlorobiota bacterium]